MKAFVLGHPIEHSLSPVLHSAAYQALGIEVDYQRYETQVEDFSQRMRMGHDDTEILGFSVTMPLKKEAYSSVQYASELGRTLGVVNTVYWRELDGEARVSFGHNTDVSGIVNALKFAGVMDAEGSFAIIGGGGTAISALVAGQVLGYRTADIFVRSAARAKDLIKVAQQIGMSLSLHEIKDFVNHAPSYKAVISTLPAGVADTWAAHLQELSPLAVLLDVSYDPWPSTLAQSWERLGGRTVSGLEMLMYQAFEQVKLFTGLEVTDRFDNELEVLQTMCRSLDLPERNLLPYPVTGLL